MQAHVNVIFGVWREGGGETMKKQTHCLPSHVFIFPETVKQSFRLETGSLSKTLRKELILHLSEHCPFFPAYRHFIIGSLIDNFGKL
jgi:hypothetical protein